MNQSEGTYKTTILNNTIQYNLAKADPSPGLAKCSLYFLFDGTCMNIRCSRAPPRSLQEEELLNENLDFNVTNVKTNSESLENSMNT